jgi:hypothetical protein
MTPALKSYLRHVLIAIVPLLTVAESQPQHYMFAVALAVVGPLIRHLDPNDHEIHSGN